MTERTLILVKPDGVERNLIGTVLARFETKGYHIADLKMLTPSHELLEKHYEEHKGKPFFQPLVDFMSSGPVVAVIFEGERVVEGARSLMGSSDPTTAPAGTIRGDFGRDWGENIQKNLVHGSDSVESAQPRQAHDHVLNKLQQEHNLIEESDEDDSEDQQVNHDDSEP